MLVGARAEAQACIPALEASVLPAESKAVAVALARLLDWIVDFGIAPLPADERARNGYLERLAGRYREHLAGLPSDLLMRCVSETMASHGFRNLPLPAEMIARVSGELARRRAALGRLRLVLKIGRFDAAPVAAADRVRPDQMRRWRQELAAGAVMRAMPGADTPEYGEPPPPANPRQDRGASA